VDVCQWRSNEAVSALRFRFPVLAVFSLEMISLRDYMLAFIKQARIFNRYGNLVCHALKDLYFVIPERIDFR
jgi:hypothetical protein